MKKFRFFIGIGLIFTIGVLSFVYYYDAKIAPSGLEDESPDVMSGAVEQSLSDSNGEGIDILSPIEPEQGTINTVFHFSHLFDDDGRYGLMILVDHEQIEFEVDGEKYDFYKFDVKPNSTVDIHTFFDVDDDAQEVVYLTVFQPDYQLSTDDHFMRASNLQLTFDLRYSISTDNPKKRGTYETLEPVESSTEVVELFDIDFTREIDEFKVMMHGQSSEEIYMSMANDTDEDLEMTVIAFEDWEQVPLGEDQLKTSVEVPSGQRNYYTITLPETDEPVNYQLFAITHPKQFDNHLGNKVMPSPRIVIEPK